MNNADEREQAKKNKEKARRYKARGRHIPTHIHTTKKERYQRQRISHRDLLDLAYEDEE